MKELIEGRHLLYGVGESHWDNEYLSEDMDAVIFNIDNQLWSMYIDPDDGYRSYACVHLATDGELQYLSMTKFPPQEVIVEFGNVKTSDDYGFTTENKSFMIIRDAITRKEIVNIGTDSTEDYYPYGYFEYHPENMNINQGK
jgi:hypothetical protein